MGVSAPPLETLTPGFRDRLGDRFIAPAASGTPLEYLCLSSRLATLPSWEAGVKERLSRLSTFRHAAYARARRLQHLLEPPQAALVSTHVPGQRLSEFLAAASRGQIQPATDAVMAIARQLMAAVALLHDHAPDLFHGALSPERLILGPEGRVVVTEYVLGPAIEQAATAWGAREVWGDLRIPVLADPRQKQYGRQVDLLQIGLVLLAAMLGRPLDEQEFPDRLETLLSSARENGPDATRIPLRPGLRTWLGRLLAVPSVQPFKSLLEAQKAFGQLAQEDRAYAPSNTSLTAFMEQCQLVAAAMAAEAAEEAARLEAERKAAEEAARVEAERKAAEEAARLEAERKAAEEAARLEAERKAAEEAARVEAERKAAEEAARLEAERQAAEEAARREAERKAAKEAARLEAERKAAEEAARLEAERKAAEEAARLEAERKAAEEAARLEAERKAAEEAARLEAERMAAEEAARLEAERQAAEEAARLEAERQAAEEAARREAERKAAEEAARVEAARQEAARKAAEEAARLEAERKAAEEAARLEAERQAAEEAARLEAERKAAEEAARLEAERQAAEEAARREAARQEAARKAAEEAARLEAERKAAEEAARLEAERKAAEEAARLEAERQAAEEAARREAARQEAARKAAEEAARLEAERKAAEEAARLEAERKAAEEAARLEAERKAAEEAARLEAERKAAEEAAHPPRDIFADAPVEATEPPLPFTYLLEDTPPAGTASPLAQTPMADSSAGSTRGETSAASPLTSDPFGPWPVAVPSESAATLFDALAAKQQGQLVPSQHVDEAPFDSRHRVPDEHAPSEHVIVLDDREWGREDRSQRRAHEELALPAPEVPLPNELAADDSFYQRESSAAHGAGVGGARTLFGASDDSEPNVVVIDQPSLVTLPPRRPEPPPERRVASATVSMLPPIVETSSSKKGLVIGLALLLVVAAAVGAYFVFAGRSSSAAEGTLVVESEPTGADILIDGQAKGKTPLTVSLPAGQHRLELRSPDITRSSSVTVGKGARVVQHIVLTKPEMGGLRIVTQPAGGTVTVDGVAKGPAPVRLNDVTPGSHLVVVESDWGSNEVEAKVESGQTLSLTVPTVGWLKFSAPIDLEVSENGKKFGNSSKGTVMVPSGRHHFDLTNQEVALRLRQFVYVQPGQVVPVPLDLPQGMMNLEADQVADVLVDGQLIGQTPQMSVPVALGRHEVTFRHPRLGEVRYPVMATLASPVSISVKFKK